MAGTPPQVAADPARRLRRLSLAVMLANVFATGLTFGIVVPILSVLLEHRGVPTWIIGLNGSMALLASFVIGPFVPAVVARLKPVAAVVAGATVVALGFLLLPAFPDVALWFPIRFLVGCGMTLLWVVSLTWLNVVTREERRGLLMGLNAALLGGGYALGPLLVTQTGIESALPFEIGAGLIGASALLLLAARRIAPTLVIPRTERLKHLRAVLVAAPVVLAVAFVAGFGETGAGAMIPIYGLRNGLSVNEAVVMVAALTAGGVALQFPVGWLADRIDRRRLLLALIAAGFAGPVLLPFLVQSGAPLWILLFLWGGAVMALYTVGLTILGQRFGSGTMTHANALFVMFYSVGSVAGSSSAGVAMDIWDPHGLPTLLGLGFFLLLAYGLIRGRPADDAPSA